MANPRVSPQQLHRTLARHPLGAGLDCYFLYRAGGISWQMVKGRSGTWRLIGFRGSGELELVFEQVMEFEKAKQYAAGFKIDLEPEQRELGL